MSRMWRQNASTNWFKARKRTIRRNFGATIIDLHRSVRYYRSLPATKNDFSMFRKIDLLVNRLITMSGRDAYDGLLATFWAMRLHFFAPVDVPALYDKLQGAPDTLAFESYVTSSLHTFRKIRCRHLEKGTMR